MDAGHFSAAVFLCILECVTDDALTRFSCNDLDRMDGVRIDLLFDADVEAFRIFTENDDIHIFERCFYGIVGSYRADVCVKIIFSAECHVQGAESLSDRGRDRGF